MNYILLALVSFCVVVLLGFVAGVIIDMGKECEADPKR